MKLKIYEWVLILLSASLLLPNLFQKNLLPLFSERHPYEQFDPSLVQQLRSVDDILKKADSIAVVKNITPSDMQYGVELNNLIQNRFYHGLSYYSLKENSIASILGYFIWDHLAAIVLPEHILKHSMAYCSQQSMVLMECFKQKEIPYRSVSFKSHYAVEGNFKNQWVYFDPDKEPVFENVERTSFQSLYDSNFVNSIYNNIIDSSEIENYFDNFVFSDPNIIPASKARVFHKVSNILSKTAFVFPLLFLFYTRRRSKKSHFR
jgi:hypothetical protein